MLEQQLVNALSLGCVYALFALGFTLVFGILGVINLSHGAVFMLGAYAALQVVLHFELPLWAALAVGFVVSGVAGLVIDVLLLRPLRRRNAPHLIPMIGTIGAGIAINNAMQGVFGAENLRFPAGLVSDASLDLGGIHLTPLELSIIVLSFALMAALMLLLKRTQLGRTARDCGVAQGGGAARHQRRRAVPADLVCSGGAGWVVGRADRPVLQRRVPADGPADAAQGHRGHHPGRPG